MSKIRVLSEHLANQIAAGEVIERPASVVKEFLENAIDAGAQQVVIEVEGDGTRLIRVIDDGDGMDQDDTLLCLERHATSKLQEGKGEEQLSTIRTLGFRGEAIPSIASVSRLSIISRPRQAELGTRVEVQYGRIAKIHETGCRQGTVMEMRNLFGNLPARKKFLKSSRTELAHIEEVVKNYSLANHRLGLTYTVDGQPVLSLPAETDTLESRLGKINGRRQSSGRLVRIEHQGETTADSPVAVSGWLLLPDETGSSAGRLRLFVNGRAIRDRMLGHAVGEGLTGYLMKGMAPAGALFLTLPPALVDVNVHPAKQEIRFRNSEAIHGQVAQAVRQAMADYQHDLKFSLFGPPAATPQSGKDNNPPAMRQSPLQEQPTARPYPLPLATPRPLVATGEEPLAFATGAGRIIQTDAAASADEAIAEMPAAPLDCHSATPAPAPTLRPIGQLLNLYLLCEGPDGLVVIDQHAAHERLLFEDLKKQLANCQLASQALLFSQMLELSASQIEVLQKYRDEIERLGLVIEEFGGQSFVLKAVPALLGHLSPGEIVAGVLEQFHEESGKTRGSAARIEEILAGLACKAAIKAGHRLEEQEMVALIAQMRESDAFSHCPHGRPTYKAFSIADVKKWFHRG
ncbi:MAG: hypothetical protein A2521_05830 [Deltaproteobacteria bacterium RIFOXYD12_FULL_57_12]|nr:MAG: hypothetical protein A2521_05830 [Deltaproteobacteria bacterium RIFOXYD12_FULL_57_12]